MKKSSFTVMAVMLAIISVSALFANGTGDKQYPTKDIQFYVNANAGGGTDTICRKVSQLAEKYLTGSFFMVNKPGVSDCVGPNFIMAAKPDGYSIGNLTYGSVVTGVYQQVIDGYDMKRLKFIALVTEESDAIMVSSRTPYKTIDDLVNAAKANPGKITIGDQGIGSRVNLTLHKFEEKYGIEFKKLSYTSSAPQREAMLNGEIDAAITSLGDFAPMLQAGQARGLVEFSVKRNNAYPDVPTSTELNMGPEVLSSSFVAIAAPAGTPAEIIQVLEAAYEKAATSQEFIDWTTTVGVTPRFLKGAELDKFITDVQDKDFQVLDDFKKQGLL